MPHIHDVIVVGAGFTGLSAALALTGRDVLVLEAADRVGGRVESARFGDGTRVDTGAQFVCDDMENVMALLRRYGKTLVHTPMDGTSLVQPPGPDDDDAYLQSRALRLQLRRLDPADPAIAGLTVADWLARQRVSTGAARAFRSTVEGLWCRPIDELPMWYLVSNDRRITNKQTEIQYFVGETIHSLADDMAADLGDRLLTGHPVRQITVTGEGVAVAAVGRMFLARQAIVAVPPVMASRIAYEPGLPPPLAAALGAWRSGAVIKVQVRYRRPFWRDDGLSGLVAWRDPLGLFSCDVSREGAGATLVVFIAGPLALSWRQMPEPALRQAIVDRLAGALGAAAREAEAIVLRDWTDDRWCGGGYGDTIFDMQAQDVEDILRAGTGPIHFASSELSPSYPCYVEGAIVAGRAVAEAIGVANSE